MTTRPKIPKPHINVELFCVACGYHGQDMVVEANREKGPRCPRCGFPLDYRKVKRIGGIKNAAGDIDS